MNLKFTGKCVATTTDKRGTLSLIVEETSAGQPTPQKVECYSRAIAEAARAVRVGDIVTVDATSSANPWRDPKTDSVVWFQKLQATFLEVGVPSDAPTGNPPEGIDDDIPF